MALTDVVAGRSSMPRDTSKENTGFSHTRTWAWKDLDVINVFDPGNKKPWQCQHSQRTRVKMSEARLSLQATSMEQPNNLCMCECTYIHMTSCCARMHVCMCLYVWGDGIVCPLFHRHSGGSSIPA